MAAIPPITPQPPAPGTWLRRGDLLWAFAIGWLLIAGILLWQAEAGSKALWTSDPNDGRGAFVFDRATVAQALATRASLLVPSPYQATVLYIAADGCRCTRRSRPHRERIEASFAGDEVRFVSVRPNDPFAAELRAAVPAAPAAVVLDRTGNVLYAGPYSNDGMCLPKAGEGAVERTLQALLAGEAPPIFNPLGVGCLCAT